MGERTNWTTPFGKASVHARLLSGVMTTSGASRNDVRWPEPPTARSAPSGGSVNPAYSIVDALRAILAGIVTFSHAWYLLIRDYRPGDGILAGLGYFAAGFAHACVVLFFVLSGYWITRSVVKRLDTGWSWPHYLADRLVRLYLVLIPALVLGGLLDAVGYHVLGTATHRAMTDTFVLKTDLGDTLSATTFLANASFLQSILARPFGSNGPLWSVAYEFWYYLWFPALALTVRTRRMSAFLPTLLLGAIASPLAIGFLCWLAGSAVYFAEKRDALTKKPATRTSATTLSLAAAAAAALLILVRLVDFAFEDVVLAAAFAVVLRLVLSARLRLPRCMNALARFGAQASFTLYAIHFPLIAFAAGLMISSERMEPGTTSLIWVVVVVTTVAWLAYGLSRVTEARTDIVRRWVSRYLPSA
ncbi:acyltransferase family protein [Sphingomonas floccifaciens]|jgi:peptidoglycan/LPS O-acetylase OafA/YrhL|uniref:LPS biosynthesis protein n=2 Tax=Sphingomonas TaxID=13687 RepID=A0A916TAR5_9SPHN|nr:acyltransferase [Sphingomonas metalli]GGB37742.1 LPS biosynthesis protein [Sphingomonas metalli]